MAHFRGRNEVKRRRDRLESAVGLIDGSTQNGELLSHYARYVVVLVSGYVEQGVKELIREYSRNHCDKRLQRYVGKQLDRVNVINPDRLKQLLDSLDPEWWPELEARHADDLQALSSIVTHRHKVSHGGDSEITVVTVRQYLSQVDPVMSWLINCLDPPPSSS
ncbi:HEPN domain-containing protein [Janibacter sp. GXQ6167]|uniref:HEPN domain-containing protein n=1 Tax=Janibacter sp. GXQ6167 TaxID=3240791 RepID=UPI0035232883